MEVPASAVPLNVRPIPVDRLAQPLSHRVRRHVADHLITCAKSNAVAHLPVPQVTPCGRGRPRIYGKKLRLKDFAQQDSEFISAPSPVYGENNVILRYRTLDLLWRPVGRLVRFLIVRHPMRGTIFLLCTDLSFEPL